MTSNNSLSKKPSTSRASPPLGTTNDPLPSGTRWPSTLPHPPHPQRNPKPHSYPLHLPLLPSSLRPPCRAKDRLILWKPYTQRTFRDLRGRPIEVSDNDLTRIQLVTSNAYADSTLQSYATGLLIFHVFCDQRKLPEVQRAPASSNLISLWLANIAGTYSGSAIKNFLYGVRAWHIIHGISWEMNDAEIDTILKAAFRLTPDSSKRKKRMPYTVTFMEMLLEDLKLDNPFDAAVAACLTTTFYSGARLGEFTVPKLSDFHQAKHVTPFHVRADQDRNGFKVTVFRIPRTKSAPLDGEDVFWAKQNGTTDPEALLQNHFRVNAPSQHQHLFAYHSNETTRSTHKPLTKRRFLERIAAAAKAKGLDPLQGHGIRIGSTLEYLLRGMPFEAVKATFRWKSDAFLVYLRKHAEIMAPYMQPELHHQFIQYTLPPVR
ncbi:hypothetical protein K435DRAFT_644252 [Dendrothele bispora CBS 962.96]|uniref:DNA breaking-rejoining enzyme n=1 Tax=Dendrothele bispora (strain CBS 962.96) TaxID=1314807 RepID=A0A4S8MW69_DENBC|nr:hypothetical protein K435DRAFT_644252 [Dendrothele bispora CBS 962.96]